jgi:hypothetical protein
MIGKQNPELRPRRLVARQLEPHGAGPRRPRAADLAPAARERSEARRGSRGGREEPPGLPHAPRLLRESRPAPRRPRSRTATRPS